MNYVKGLLIVLGPESIIWRGMKFCVYVLCEKTLYHASTWEYKTQEGSNFLQFRVYLLCEGSTYDATI